MYACCRLLDYKERHQLKECGHGYAAGFGGNCLTDSIVDNLWRIHYEVNFMTFKFYNYSNLYSYV